VELSHRALVSALYAQRRLGGSNSSDVVLSASPLGSANAIAELLLPLAFGARIELADSGDLASPQRLAARAAACEATLIQAPPSVWQQLLDAGWTGGKALRIIATGEPLGRPLVQRLLPLCRELWNVYGAAETGGGCVAALVPPDQSKPLIGRPLGNVQVHVLDAHLHPVPVGITGELYVGGDTLATGYRDLPAATIAQFPADPFRRIPGARLFRTGDLARRLPNGEIDLLARADHRTARHPSPFAAPEPKVAVAPAALPPQPAATPPVEGILEPVPSASAFPAIAAVAPGAA
jgi:non-ribosomal peptide synthetase component F